MNRIRIRWPGDHSIETVCAPLEAEPTDNEIQRTAVYYVEEDKCFDAITTSQRTIDTDGTQCILIHHFIENYTADELQERAGEFPEFDPASWLWGTATITVSPLLDSADANWVGQNNHDYDGEGQCSIFLEELCIVHDREAISRNKREQARFKKSLREVGDNCCAITGETTRAALEAAHIVPANQGGPESLNNGILLRADLHRLYDACLFKIREDGSIEIVGQISAAYTDILGDTIIDNRIIERISAALAERARLKPGC